MHIECPPGGSFLRSLVLVTLCLLAGFSAGPAAAQPGPPTPEPLPTNADLVGPIKLRDESVDQILQLLERWTGRIILRPQGLPNGTYTLTMDEPVPVDEAVVALETLLNLNGIAAVRMGDEFLKITPLNMARVEAPFFIEGSTLDLPASGRIATKLFELNFLRVSEFLPQISAILNPGLGTAPVIFEKSNSAMVTDSVANLQRIEMLLQRLDEPRLTNQTTKFYPLLSAKASDVVNQLRTLLGGPLQNQLGAATSYLADDRTNQIILVSDPRQHAFFDELIERLDVLADPNTRNVVIPLKHASANEVATLLGQLVSGQNTATAGSGVDSARTIASFAPAATPAPDGTAAAPSPTGTPATPATPAATVELPAVDRQEFSNLLTILPEERSNAIVVSGTRDDIRLIRELIQEIDVLLAQVRIEVVIAEVTLSDEASSGISELGLRVQGDKLIGFSAAGAGFAIIDGILSTGPDGSTDLAADIGLTTTPRKNNTTILSNPTIITTHNTEGSIFVGEQRPVISSYLNDASSNPGTIGSGYRSTVSFMDIGIELIVKPLIGNDGSVQLEITSEVNDVLGDVVIDGNAQPRVGRRSTTSFISVMSNEIIVLGGLQRTSRSRNTNRLGPIPFLGDLLGSRRREDSRTDLVFFLRPYVLTNTPEDNVDALRRIDSGPQSDAVREALELVKPAPQPTERSRVR